MFGNHVGMEGFYVMCGGGFLLTDFISLVNTWLRSVTQSCPTLCDPMDCSTPGFPVLHHLPELTQTHVHWVGDAIQPCHPLLSSSPLPSVLPSIRVFSIESVLGASASALVLPMNIQGWFLLGLMVWSPCFPRDSQESSPTPQLGVINCLVLCLLYGPSLTSIHDYWKNRSFD